LKAFRPDMLRNRARNTSVHSRRAGRRQKWGGRGRASRASPRRGAPATPPSRRRGPRSTPPTHPTPPTNPTPSTLPTHLIPPTTPTPPVHPDRQFPPSGKSVLSAPRGACNRPPCRRGAPRIVEGPQVLGGQVTRAASSARDVIGTNEKNQQTENGQTTEPQLVSAIRSKRVSARAARLGLLDLLATTGPCPVPIGQCAEPRLAVTLSHRRSYPDRRPFVLVHYVSLRMRAPGGSIERFDNSVAAGSLHLFESPRL
jgi:hypothetical protein